MGTSLIITIRESLEIVLLIIPLLVYLKKIDMVKLSKYLYFGIVSGVLSSVVLGSTLYTVLINFSPALQEIFVGLLALVISALILYNIITINKQKALTDSSTFSNTVAPSTLFLLSFITVFRECLEIILFTLPTLLTSFSSFLIGTLLGLVITTVIGFLIYYTSGKININLIFVIITGILIYFGALMFGEALFSFLPQYGEGLIQVGALIYGIPTTLIYVKKYLKILLKKIK